MSESYPALVIGCGRIGSSFDEGRTEPPESHAGGYRRCDRARLAGLCDASASRVAEAAQHWRVDIAETDVQCALRRTNPVLVSVCTPDTTHAEVLRQVLDYPSVRGALAEKPLAGTAAEAREIVALAEQRGVSLAVNYSRRFHPAFQRVAEALKVGEIGPIQAVSGFYSKGLAHNGTHWLDLARWMVGEVAHVHVVGGGLASEEDPTVDVALSFVSGAHGLLLGCDQKHYSIFELDILGEQGRVRITAGPRFEWYDVRDNERFVGFRHLKSVRDEAPASESVITNAIENLIDCVEGKATPLCSGADGVAVLELVEQALAQ